MTPRQPALSLWTPQPAAAPGLSSASSRGGGCGGARCDVAAATGTAERHYERIPTYPSYVARCHPSTACGAGASAARVQPCSVARRSSRVLRPLVAACSGPRRRALRPLRRACRSRGGCWRWARRRAARAWRSRAVVRYMRCAERCAAALRSASRLLHSAARCCRRCARRRGRDAAASRARRRCAAPPTLSLNAELTRASPACRRRQQMPPRRCG